MLLAHGGGICPIEVWAAIATLSAAGGAKLLWDMFCVKCRKFFRRGSHKHEDPN